MSKNLITLVVVSWLMIPCNLLPIYWTVQCYKSEDYIMNLDYSEKLQISSHLVCYQFESLQTAVQHATELFKMYELLQNKAFLICSEFSSQYLAFGIMGMTSMNCIA
jgi:hypothetical protein